MMFDPITCHGQSWGNYCLHAKENDVEREYDKEQV